MAVNPWKWARRAGVAGVGLFTIVAMVAASGAHGESLPPTVPPLLAPLQAPHAAKAPEIDSGLARVASIAGRQGVPAALAAARADGLGVRSGLVHVIVEAGTGGTGAASSAITAAGGHVDASFANLVEALVPPAALTAVAGSPAVALVRPPYAHSVDAVSGEEVSATNAAALQSAGINGAGVKVAIIDLGFGGLAAREAAGEIPAGAVNVDMCPVDGYSNEVHGTAVAEIVHEMAPSAQLYLICIDDEVSLGNAEAYAKANHIQIISHSVGWFNTSRGDGSGGAGTPDAIAADATANGILWINSAGNEAQQHWSGNFVDDGSSFNAFAPGVHTDGFFVAGGGTACVFLKWDGWPITTQDYDLGLYSQSGGSPVATSVNDQTTGAPPVEALCYTNPGPTAPFYVAIVKFAATSAPRFDLFVEGDVGPPQYQVPAGSLTEPASSPQTFAAGAICWQNSALEPYSSQGPTIDGRTKPDIAGQDSESSATYGGFSGCGTSGFSGTSAAAPTTAGAAALLWSLHPTWDYRQVESALQAQAIDLGTPGIDNLFGAGGLHLSLPQLATHLSLAAPATSTSGIPFSIVVQAFDATNNPVSSYRGTIHFTSSESGAGLPADYTFTAGDAGVHAFAGAFTLHTPGPQSITATDAAQASINGSASINVLGADLTPPAIQIVAPTEGSHYAQHAGVQADYSCADEFGGSGLKSCVGTAANGASIDTTTLGSKAFTVTATDNAGNATSQTVHYTVDDVTKPTVTIVTPGANASYKKGAGVNASYHCDDEAGGSGIATCVGTTANGAAIDTATEGPHSFTVTAQDNAGNVGGAVVNYKVDGTAPAIHVTLPLEGATYARGSVQIAAYSCDDILGSGVASCVGPVPPGSAIDTGTLGDKTFTINAVDNVGNAAALTVHYHVTDQAAPAVTITTPTDNAHYVRGANVAAVYACVDDAGGSGLKSCAGTVANGASIDTSSLGSKAFTVTATDNAGNPTTLTVHYSVDDGTKPAVTVTTPAEGATYDLGSTVNSAFACTDEAGGSGIDSCIADVASSGDPINTASIGSRTFTVTATDKAGNTTTVVRHYTVVKQAHNPAVAAGGTLSTGSSSTPADPVQVGVTTPTGGSVDETVRTASISAPSGYTLAAYQVDITAPAESADKPLTIVFTLDGSLIPSGFTKDTLAVFRNGSLVPACSDTSGKAVPSPCVAKREAGSGDDVKITILTAAAGTWNFGFLIPAAAPPSVGGGGGGGAGGGGGGGGGGGLPPDLHVDVTANVAQTPAVGSEVIYFVKVSAKGGGSASAVRLDLTLPAGFTVTRTYTDRGPGCTGTAPNLTCDVAWVELGINSNVTIWGTVGQAGEQDLTATVTSLVETETASTLADNTTTLKLLPVAAPPSPAGGTFTPPARVTRVPSVTGAGRPGGVVRAVPPRWSSPPATIKYQWQLCTTKACRSIAGANKLTLKITRAYVGKSVRLLATATIGSQTLKTYSRQVAIKR